MRFVVSALLLACTARLFAATPVILHTDIGTDIDDTWALAQVLRSPELDLKLVVVDTGDVRYRAKVAAKVLEAAGRDAVPIALGVAGTTNLDRNQEPWIKGYDLAHYRGRVLDDGAAAFIDVVMHARQPVTIISVGPVPALAEALRREPKLAERARWVGMHGSFDLGYNGAHAASAESNVKIDPVALRVVLAAPWRDALITPLDTCGSVELAGDNYYAIWCDTKDPLVRAVIEGYCVFAPHQTWFNCDFFTTKSTTLFDCVAVYLAYSEDLVDIETLHVGVTDDGFTRRDLNGPAVRVALRWKDKSVWEDRLAKRLLGDNKR